METFANIVAGFMVVFMGIPLILVSIVMWSNVFNNNDEPFMLDQPVRGEGEPHGD